MQRWIDVEEAGWSLSPTTTRLLPNVLPLDSQHAWTLRNNCMRLEYLSTTDAIKLADDPTRGIFLLSDTGDSVFGGSPGDSTVNLRALLATELQHRALVPITDPVAVQYLVACDIGATVRRQKE